MSNGTTLTKKQMAMFAVLIGVAVFLGVYFGIYFGSRGLGRHGEAPVEAKFKANDPLPDVAVLDVNGTVEALTKKFTGKGAVVLFMSLGCHPCQEESEKWQKILAEKKPGDFAVLGVCYDKIEQIQAYLKEHGFTFPIYCDSARLFMRDWSVAQFPTVAVVNREGKIAKVYSGFQADFDDKEVKKVLKT